MSIDMAHIEGPEKKKKLSGSLTNNSLDRETVRQWTKEKKKTKDHISSLRN